MAWAFEFVEVCFRTGERRVLDGISFGVRLGESVALHGPPDSGKTVAFRLLVGLERADEGAVVVAGRDVGRGGARARRLLQRRLAAVFQGGVDGGYGIFEDVDVLENVSLPMRAAGRAPRRRLHAVAREELARFGLAEHAAASPGTLDRDARKRLALARALALRSPLLVIDALEDGLRPDSLALVAGALSDLGPERGTSVLFTTRDAGLARAVADRVVDLDGPDAGPRPAG